MHFGEQSIIAIGIIQFYPDILTWSIFSEVPNELIRAAKGGEVNLNMEDHRTENYVKPKVSLKAFSGEGHTLGRYLQDQTRLSRDCSK